MLHKYEANPSDVLEQGSATVDTLVQVTRRRPRELVFDDPRMIRAIAHPARIAVVETLYGGVEALTASECAELAGLSASAMSYHLRALEKWGVIERAPARPDARERPWRAAADSLRVTAGDRLSGGDRADLLAASVERLRRGMDARVRDEPEPEWHGATSLTTQAAWLTPEEARKLDEHIQAILRERRGRRRKGTRRVEMFWAIYLSRDDLPG